MKLYQNLVLIMIKVYNDLVDSTVWTAFYTTIHIDGLATAISCSKFIQGEKQDIDRSLQAIYKSFHWSKGNMNAQEKESNHTALDSAFQSPKTTCGAIGQQKQRVELTFQTNLFDI